MKYPKVLILMATYNGLDWLPNQISSIFNQVDVDVTLLVSDDCSSDGSYKYLKQVSLSDDRLVLLPQVERFGSAGQNFYHLINSANFNDFDYVAFSDQDDIWEENKLISHVSIAKQCEADGVSSNVTAFWEDGRQKVVAKSQQQRKWDYLFESSGPGCSFLMSPWLVGKVREQLVDEVSPAKRVELHDWLTYATCRAHGRKWVIDSKSSLNYRQHNKNAVGANVGIGAKLARLKGVQQRWYRAEILKIMQVCNIIDPASIELNHLLLTLSSKSWFSRLQLLTHVCDARRSVLDRYLLAASIVIGVF